MKYLQFGSAIAACTVAAIYLTHVGGTLSVPPNAVPQGHVGANATVLPAVADATSYNELSRLHAAQALGVQQAEQAKPDKASPDTAEAGSDSPAATAPDLVNAAPIKLNDETLQSSEQASHDLAAPDALSEHESLPPSVEKAAAESTRAETTGLERDSPEGAELTNSSIAQPVQSQDSAVPAVAADETIIVPESPSASSLSAVAVASQDASAQLLKENPGIDVPKPEQAEANSHESPEPAHEYRTASASDEVDNVAPGVVPSAPALSAIPGAPAPLLPDKQAVTGAPRMEQANLEDNGAAVGDDLPVSLPPNRSYLAYYVYDEHPPPRRPADIVLDSLRNVPIGTPLEEIKRAADAFGLNYNFMKTVAKIESDFNPRQRTGSYIGLFQLNHYEFNKYGSGEITNPRDNAIAAAYKFITEGTMFEWDTHKDPTFSDLYLIHQQGWQGAAEHVAHPWRIAWQSMCATDEGKEKGEKWCKRAVWQNTLPNIKQLWKSVENMTSNAFVYMWRQRVEQLYSRYSGVLAGKSNDDNASNPPSYLKPPPAASAAPSADGRRKFARQIAAGKARSTHAGQERSAEGRKEPGHQIAAIQARSPQTAKERRADGRKRLGHQIAANRAGLASAAAEHPAEGRKKLTRLIAVPPAKSPQAVPAHAVTGRHHRPRGTTALRTIPNRTS
jgi:hypothetical protein